MNRQPAQVAQNDPVLKSNAGWDSPEHKFFRMKMVNAIHAKGITDSAVLSALLNVPRHLFIESSLSPLEAYQDQALPIEYGQTISQPFTVAYQTSLLEIDKDEKVLEIGTGSGYQAAILSELGASVYSVERHKQLYSSAKERLQGLGYSRIRLFYADGTDGLLHRAPFDKILVTAASRAIPPELVNQLKIGGRMVIPVGQQTQKMLRISKLSATRIKTEPFDEFVFVPFLTGLSEDTSSP